MDKVTGTTTPKNIDNFFLWFSGSKIKNKKSIDQSLNKYYIIIYL